MLSPINNVHSADAQQVSHPPSEPRPDPKAQTPPVQKSGQLSQDQVTLKSAGQPDHDGDRR